jgi:hypothetical protein
MPNAPYVLDIGHKHGRTYRVYPYQGRTDSTGHLGEAVGGQFDLASGDDLALACYFPSGDVYGLENIMR